MSPVLPIGLYYDSVVSHGDVGVAAVDAAGIVCLGTCCIAIVVPMGKEIKSKV